MMKKCLLLSAWLLATSMASAEVTTQIKREQFRQRIMQQTQAGRLTELEAEASRLTQNKERADDGQWQVAALYYAVKAGMASVADNQPEADKLEKALLQFALKKKTSQAWLMYVAALDARAWHSRGDGFASTVTPEGWAGFRKYINLARSTLDAHKDISAKDPAWYGYRLDMSMYANESDEKFNRVFMEGIKLEPAYHPLFFTKMRRLFPIWGGSQAEMVRFANEAVKQVGKSEGVSIYARLAWVADSSGYSEMKFAKGIDWTLMKRAFADLLNAYPVDWNAQKLFFMACEKPDKAEAQRILKYVKEAPSPALLNNNVAVFQMCVDWANGKVPAFLMRDPRTGEEKLIE